MSWIGIASAVGSAVAGGVSANNARKAAKRAAARQESAITGAYEDAAGYYQPYSDFGTSALRNLARLTGNRAYLSSLPVSKEATELSQLKSELAELKAPGGYEGSKYALPADKLPGNIDPGAMYRNKKKKKAKAEYQAQIAAYETDKAKKEARIAELEPIVAQQTQTAANSPQETVGADYLRELPGYQFRLGEGQRAVDNTQSRRNMALSGAALREIGQYNQDFASTEYQNEFSRLYQMAGLGVNAVTGQANAALGVGTGLSNIYGQQGADQANYYQSVNNAVQSGLGNVAYQYGKSQTAGNPTTSYGSQQYGPSDYSLSGTDTTNWTNGWPE